MKYRVKFGHYGHYSEELTKKQAIQQAKDFIMAGEEYVFITWFRKKDGQQGYLNPDGNHAITGRAWD